MKAIEVTSWGKQPVFNPSSPTSPQPDSGSNLVQVNIIAAGLHNLVRSLATGKHYAINPSTVTLPYIPGSDAVGTTADGQLVYINTLKTGGAFAEVVNLPKQAVTPIPVGKDASAERKRQVAVRIAALFNPAMSSWMALKTRVSPTTLSQEGGWTLLILGVTTLSGQVAAKLARHLGVKTIIGVARNVAALEKLKASNAIDAWVKLEDNATETNFASVLQGEKRHKVDVILDYLYGPATLALLNALPSDSLTAHDNSVEYVQIGSVSGIMDIDFPSALLRSKNLTLRGAGPGAWSVTKDAATHFPALLTRLVEDDDDFDLEQFPVIQQKPLEEADEAWSDSKSRTVFVV